MHRLRRRRRDDRGAVAIVVAMLMTGLLVVTALVLDFGIVRVDRQIDRAAADEAALAGLYALDQGDGSPHPYAGVCSAVQYLKANSPRFAAASATSGWKNGNGGLSTDGCATAKKAITCLPTDKSTWAVWSWTGTYQGVDLSVSIASGYDLAANNTWKEDGLTATTGDNGVGQGCDNLAVTINQSREPGLGSLATPDDLSTGIRSVGRIKIGDGDSAPAMLLLKQTGCPMLKTGSNTSPATSWVRVFGAVTSDGRSQPGTIHSDSDGAGCTGGNNSWIFGGRGSGGIVAYAAPLPSGAADPSKPGAITAYAASLGISGTPVRDSLDNVHGTTVLNGTGGTFGEVTGRPRVTRKYLDERYFTGVKCALSGGCTNATNVGGAVARFNAGATAWSATPAATATISGWTPLSAADRCKPTQAEINASVTTANTNSGGRLFINCQSNSGFAGDTSLTIGASQVYFVGVVSPAANLSLPNATSVYIGNHGDRATALSTNTSAQAFQVNNSATNLSGTDCATGLSTSKAAVFVRKGDISMSGGLLRMCRTTLFMLGGMTTTVGGVGPGCVPTNVGAVPTTTPCNGSTGSGQITMTSTSSVNWTAPNTIDPTTVNNVSTPAAIAAWSNPAGPEDLALWSESYGGASSPTFSMTGSGALNVRGVFAAPNADPFTIGGGSGQALVNAQYIASSVALNGANTTISMTVDPNSAVTIPEVYTVGLVR